MVGLRSLLWIYEADLKQNLKNQKLILMALKTWFGAFLGENKFSFLERLNKP